MTVTGISATSPAVLSTRASRQLISKLAWRSIAPSTGTDSVDTVAWLIAGVAQGVVAFFIAAYFVGEVRLERLRQAGDQLMLQRMYGVRAVDKR